MSYWFQDEGLKGLLPLATSTSMKGLTTFFNIPSLVMGANALPEGMVIGPSVIDFLGSACAKKRAFIVTDETCEKYTKRVVHSFSMGGFTTTVWNKALPEAPLDNVQTCSEEMKIFEPDLVIAVGGGSVMDSAKGAWVLYERPDITDLRAQISPLELLGLRKKAFFAAIPTTSGTGSECTPVAVLHDTETHRKIPIAGGELVPDAAILVPEFTMGMPPKITAGTGLDALAHAIDGIMTPAANELTDAMGLGAIKLVCKFLPRAYRNGKDREARHRMQVAACMAGICFGQNSAALTHSFGHSLGSMFGIHHGLAVGIFIPYALQYYKTVSDRHLEICDALKIPEGSDEARLDMLVEKIRALLRELDTPLSLKDLGIPADKFREVMDTLVLFTTEDIDTFFSPRPITTDQCVRIFEYAYEGTDIDF